MIRIDGEVSKVREPRNVTIQPNLPAWLRAYPLKEFPIIPANLQHIREKVAGKFPLTHDVMRHTFISMFVAKFRSIGEASLQAGNLESIIRKHYLDLKTTGEAEEFFSILPKKADVTAAPAPSTMANAACVTEMLRNLQLVRSGAQSLGIDGRRFFRSTVRVSHLSSPTQAPLRAIAVASKAPICRSTSDALRWSNRRGSNTAAAPLPPGGAVEPEAFANERSA